MTTVTAALGAVPYAVTLTDEEGHLWHADEPLDKGGGNSGPTPEQLLLSSLGACTAITLKMYAARKAWSLDAVRVHLHMAEKSTSSTPAHSEIALSLELEGDLDETQRNRLRQVAEACPVHKILTGTISIVTNLGT